MVRAELRYVAHGSTDQLVLFDDLGVSVPTRIEASEVGLGRQSPMDVLTVCGPSGYQLYRMRAA